MTMKTELDETERRAYAGTLSRDRDPVVPRGSVVAGEDREVGGAEDLPPAWFCPDCGGAVTWAAAIADLAVAKGDLRSAQERIRALEEERDRLAERVAQNVMALSERDARLEELRPVVRAAIALLHTRSRTDHREIVLRTIGRRVDALSPTTRKWAEGEGEEEIK